MTERAIRGLPRQQIDDEDGNSHEDAGVRDVEVRPRIARPKTNVEEVDDLAA